MAGTARDESGNRGSRSQTLTVDFLLHLSHDLRSSLRAIRLNAEMLEKDWKAGRTDNSARHVGVILGDTGRVELLASALAAYALAGQIQPEAFLVVPVEPVLRRVLAKLAHELRENAAVVTCAALPRVLCEPDQIGILFENLIRNALVHRNAAPPRISITAEEHEDRWVFAVRDNGPGIEPSYLDRIFEPFERLRGQQAAGPGLGLAICREIVNRHGGRIWAESQLGNGAAFFFTLPA